MKSLRYLIVAHSRDETAVRVFCALKARHGAETVRIVASEEVEMASRWSFHLDGGTVRSRVCLAAGGVLEGESIAAVYQRIRAVEMPHFAGASAGNREYAISEMYSLLLAWLSSLSCPVVNPPHPLGLGGVERGPLDWLVLGNLAGLPVVDFKWNMNADLTEPCGSKRMSVVVAGESVLGNVPRDIEPGCKRLARLAGCTLLELFFVSDPTGWRFCGATPYPSDPARIVTALEQIA